MIRKLLFYFLIIPFAASAQVSAPTSVTTKLSPNSPMSFNSLYQTPNFQYGWLNGTTWEQFVTGRQITKFYYPKTHIDSVQSGLLNPIKYIVANAINITGDSYAAGQQATSFAFSSYGLLSTQLGLPLNNYASGGTGVWYAAKQLNANENIGQAAFTAVNSGLNDIRRNGSNALTLTKIANCYTAIFANHFLDSLTAAGTTTNRIVETTPGAPWSNNYNAVNVGGKTSAGAQTSINGSTITYYFYGDNLVLGMIGTDGTLYTYGTANVTIDGVAQTAINQNFQTDGVSDGINDNGRSPYVIIYSGLKQGSHSITITTTSSNVFAIDYFGQLKNASNTTPLLINKIAYMTATGYAASPNLANNTVVNAANARLVSTVNSWPSKYPVYLAETNSYYTPSSLTVSSDSIHPNNRGYRQIYQAEYAAIQSLQNQPQPLTVLNTPTFASAKFTNLTAGVHPYTNSSGVLANSSTYYDSTTGYTGVGASGVNLDSYFRVLVPGSHGASVRVGRLGSKIFADADSVYIRSSIGGAIAAFNSTDAYWGVNMTPNTNGTQTFGTSGSRWGALYGTTANFNGNVLFGAGSTSSASGTIPTGVAKTSPITGDFYFDNNYLNISNSVGAYQQLLNQNGAQAVRAKIFGTTNTFNTATGTAGTDSLVVKNSLGLRAIAPLSYVPINSGIANVGIAWQAGSAMTLTNAYISMGIAGTSAYVHWYNPNAGTDLKRWDEVGDASGVRQFRALTDAGGATAYKQYYRSAGVVTDELSNARLVIGTSLAFGSGVSLLDIAATTRISRPMPAQTLGQYNAISKPINSWAYITAAGSGAGKPFWYDGTFNRVVLDSARAAAAFAPISINGTVTGVTSANTDIGVATGTTTPVLTFNRAGNFAWTGNSTYAGSETFNGSLVAGNGVGLTLNNVGNTFNTSVTPGTITANRAITTPDMSGVVVLGNRVTLISSGNGVLTTISIPHFVAGVTSTSSITATARSAAAGGYSYVTTDATNVNFIYTVAPAIGTNNLTYNVVIQP